MTARSRLLGALLLLLAASPLASQQVSVDRGRRIAGLWCFPLAQDPSTWVYVPAEARLARDGAGLPQFSLLRYVLPGRDSAGGSPIRTASGGGLLHFLVEYYTPPATIAEVVKELPEVTGDSLATLRGPFVFSNARFTLVSSLLRGDSSSAQVLATGPAPALEGNRLALSFSLSALQTELLLRSLEQATSDISLVFDLGFSGLTDAYQAELEVDWEAVQHSFKAGVGVTIYVVSADVEAKFDELRRTGGIKFTSAGTDGVTEAMVQTAYQRLTDLLFRPVEPADVPRESQGGVLDALGQVMGSQGGTSSVGFGLHLTYRMAELKQSGHSTLSFNHRASVTRQAMLVFNAGPLLRQYGADPRFSRVVAVGDPLFRRREIQIGVDGELLPEFAHTINSVTVTLRKHHESGTTTVTQALVSPATVGANAPVPTVSYGWDADSNDLGWLGYEYKTRWQFVGGALLESSWEQSDAAMINLHTPYTRRRVELAGDYSALARRGIKAVIVQLSWPFFGTARQDQRVVRPQSPPGAPVAFDVTLPRDSLAYGYSITWQFDGRRVSRQGRDDVGLVFVDDLPTEAGPAPAVPVQPASAPQRR